jgi:hypothetical protein
LAIFTKICQETPNSIKTGQTYLALCVKISVGLNCWLHYEILCSWTSLLLFHGSAQRFYISDSYV